MTDNLPFFSNGDYDKFGDLLISIFLHGGYSKSDLVSQRARSSSTLEKNIQQVERMLGLYVSREISTKGSRYSINLDSFEDSVNILCKTFRTKSTTVHRMNLFIHALDVISRQPGLRASQVCDEVNRFIALAETDFVPSREYGAKTLTPLLIDLCKEGVLVREKYKNAYTYSLAADIFADLSAEEIRQVYYAVTALAKVVYPYAAGESLANYLHYYCLIKRKLLLTAPKHMLFKFRDFHATVQDQKVWMLLKAISGRMKVRIEYAPKTDYKELPPSVAPMKIMYQPKYGRVYLVAYDTETYEHYQYRLDRIKEIVITGEHYDCSETLLDELDHMAVHMWETAMLPQGSKPIVVEMLFDLADSRRMYFLRRLEREKKHGTLEQRSDTHWYLRLLVNDVHELKPWIKSFGDVVEVLPSPDHNLRAMLVEDFTEGLSHYEHVQ